MVDTTTPWSPLQLDSELLGLEASSGLFQAVIYEVIQGLIEALAYQNDVIIIDVTRERCNFGLKSLLHRLIQLNSSIKTTEYQFYMTEPEFYGFIINTTGH